jgi:hypothetical protein
MLYHNCFFVFALIYIISKIQDDQMELKLNEAHQQVAYAGDVNLLGDNIGTI